MDNFSTFTQQLPTSSSPSSHQPVYSSSLLGAASSSPFAAQTAAFTNDSCFVQSKMHWFPLAGDSCKPVEHRSYGVQWVVHSVGLSLSGLGCWDRAIFTTMSQTRSIQLRKMDDSQSPGTYPICVGVGRRSPSMPNSSTVPRPK